MLAGDTESRWKLTEGNENMFWKEVYAVRKLEQTRREVEKDKNGEILWEVEKVRNSI